MRLRGYQRLEVLLNNEEWLPLWARRYGVSAVETLAGELRRFPRQARRD